MLVTDRKLRNDAMEEAIKRYGEAGDVLGALVFFRVATGEAFGKITPEALAWAAEMVSNEELRTGKKYL